MYTYDYNRPSPKTIKSALTLRELADFDETGGNKDRVDNVQNNQVLVSLSQLDRPRTFSFRYISDLIEGGTGVSISDKDGIITIATSLKLDNLIDVAITSPAVNDMLLFNGTNWVNTPFVGGGDMLKSVYDTDNDGIVDKAETVQIIVRNSTGVTLTKGQVVYLFGATGNRPNAVLSSASTEATSSKTIGLVSADILNNADGNVTVSGSMHDLALNMYAAGDRLWLDTTPGGMVANTPPAEPNHAVFIGTVARAHPTQGRLILAIQNGYELNELHGVETPSPANGNVLTFESSTGLWKDKSISSTLGYTLEDLEALMIAYSTAL